ncbi:MAG: transporter substrate-binding domain-containing protein [Clostridia bacterium]
MKGLKKLLLVAVIAVMAILPVAFVGCGNKVGKTVALKAEDLSLESYGIACQKGDTATLTALNAVLADFTKKDETGVSKLDNSKLFHFNGDASKKVELPDLSAYKDSAKKVVIYTESTFPPYEYMGSDNNVCGIDIDIAYFLADSLKCKLEISDIGFDSIIPSVQKADISKVHAIGAAGMSITEERKAQVDFSVEYSTAQQFIISAEKNAYKTIASLKGLKVAVQESTTGHFSCKDMGVDSIKAFKKTTDCYMALKNGTVDAVVIDSFPAQKLIEKDKDNK